MKSETRIALFLLSVAIALSSCSKTADADDAEFFADMVVPVAAGFDQAGAEEILQECSAIESTVTILPGNTVRFEPAPGHSVETSACVLDRLISSGRPPLENFGVVPEPAESEASAN